MRALLASLAIVLLSSGAGHAQAREVTAQKAAASPTTKAKVTPRVRPANATVPSQPTADQRAYSDLVDNVSKTMNAFADDNTTANQGRDHLDALPADAPTEAAEGKAPVAPTKGKDP